jgi:hypothetical protein
MYARKNGLVKLEGDVEEPAKSPVFSTFPKFVKDRFQAHGGVGGLHELGNLPRNSHSKKTTRRIRRTGESPFWCSIRYRRRAGSFALPATSQICERSFPASKPDGLFRLQHEQSVPG